MTQHVRGRSRIEQDEVLGQLDEVVEQLNALDVSPGGRFLIDCTTGLLADLARLLRQRTAELDEAAGVAGVLQLEIDAGKHERAGLQAERDRLQRSRNDLRGDCERLRAGNQSLKAANESLRGECDRLRAAFHLRAAGAAAAPSHGPVDISLAQIRSELERAMRKHPTGMRSMHEAHSVIREEFEEFWEAVRADNLPDARLEVIQLGAMCVRFLVDVCPGVEPAWPVRPASRHDGERAA